MYRCGGGQFGVVGTVLYSAPQGWRRTVRTRTRLRTHLSPCDYSCHERDCRKAIHCKPVAAGCDESPIFGVQKSLSIQLVWCFARGRGWDHCLDLPASQPFLENVGIIVGSLLAGLARSGNGMVILMSAISGAQGEGDRFATII